MQPATQIALRIGDEWKTDFPNAKVLVAQIKTGDAWRITSGGGGGYGSAFDRPPEEVREDVYQGYVSVKAAAELYGVIIDPANYRDRSSCDRAVPFPRFRSEGEARS